MDKTDLRSLYAEELQEWLASFGEPKYRAKQLYRRFRAGVTDWDGMTDLPLALREKLKETAYIADAKIVRRFVSQLDETVKYVFELYDGEWIESVLMRYEHGYTVCISTQVGCRMGCEFCASGIGGLIRSLTASEMLAQITAIAKDRGIRVSNVVMMGMGEPLDNFEATVRFLKLVSDPEGLHIGLRHISLSTSGVVSGIDRLREYGFPVTLSVSLHAPNDAIRNRIMPVSRKWSIEELLDACKRYQAVTTRRISFEYALMSGVNDNDACAAELAARLKGILCHVNLIPANPVTEKQFQKPDRNRIYHFQQMLTEKGINATVRRTLGADINASCGQLRKRAKEEDGIADLQ